MYEDGQRSMKVWCLESLFIKGQARNQLGTSGGAKSFLRVAQMF